MSFWRSLVPRVVWVLTNVNQTRYGLGMNHERCFYRANSRIQDLSYKIRINQQVVIREICSFKGKKIQSLCHCWTNAAYPHHEGSERISHEVHVCCQRWNTATYDPFYRYNHDSCFYHRMWGHPQPELPFHSMIAPSPLDMRAFDYVSRFDPLSNTIHWLARRIFDL